MAFLSAQEVATTDEVKKDKNAAKKEIIQQVYTTTQIKDKAPIIDGNINDDAWQAVPYGGGFTQQRPNEGEAPSVETQFKILYDDKNIYIAFLCHDPDPDKIERRMSRRDGFEGDWVEVNIDSYGDKRTAFSFTITAAGVKGDEYITNDGNNWDSSWDPIWYAKAAIVEEGWTAEVRIPLSQLRYGEKEHHEWGIQMTRRFFREQERSLWQFVSQNTAGWVSHFGTLNGIRGIKAQKQIEIQPYVLAQGETFEAVEGNPFATGRDNKLSAGVDGKIGITGDLMLDFTINPDFGQVEADPSVLILDGFQPFFSERRPFFIENNNIFDFRLTQAEAGGPFTRDNIFYSRRIGQNPHFYPSTSDGEYVDMPENTSILGAAKFSGKTQNGTSIGILESLTARESALIDNNGEQREEMVEPMTNYFVGRLQQDVNDGNTYFGGILTNTRRYGTDEELQYLHRSATTGGFDFTHRWKDRAWYFSVNTVFSKVNGTEEAILNTQTSFEHLFQRPDADYVEVDPTRTSLVGNGGTIKLGEVGGGKDHNFNFDAGVTWRTPGLELNDIGFMRNADDAVHFLWAGYRYNKPFSIFNNVRVNYNHWFGWNFGGLNTYQGWNTNAHVTFKNFYRIGSGLNYEHKVISNTALRGGPSMRFAGGLSNWVYASSDERKKLTVFFNMFNYWGAEESARSSGVFVGLQYQPLRVLRISLNPGFNQRNSELQYVSNIELPDGDMRYVNADISQRTFDLSIRINYSITPNLSLQYYGSPFISKGNYSDFKYITDPVGEQFEDRFERYSYSQIVENGDGDFDIDEDLDGNTDYTIYNPDFNFMQFRSNLVARWEYIPGSTIFLVWSQGTTNFGDPTMQLMPSLSENLFSNQIHNIFLLKFTYRFINVGSVFK